VNVAIGNGQTHLPGDSHVCDVSSAPMGVILTADRGESDVTSRPLPSRSVSQLEMRR
jgi:hypothetical protein